MTWPQARVVVALALAAGAAAVAAASCGAPGDDYAVLEVLLCDRDADCEAGTCEVDGEEVPVQRVLARAVESRDASRHAPEGLFALASWDEADVWSELELDLPLDREGYVELTATYSEHREGEPLFVATSARGRIVVVLPPGGDGPSAIHLELAFGDDEGETRRLHMGRVLPDEGTLPDPGVVASSVDWEQEGVELLVVEADRGPSGQPPRFPTSVYDADYRTDGQSYLLPEADCTVDTGDDCDGEDDPYVDDGEYDGACGGGDSWDVDGCEGDSASSSGWESCETDDGGFCAGDDWSSDGGGDCAGDDWSGDGGGDCSGDDWSGDGGGFDCSDADLGGDGGGFDCGDSGCEGDLVDRAEARAGARRRSALRALARGHAPPSPVRRAGSFSPVVLALLLSRLLFRR